MSYLKNKKILILGASGQIGLELIDHLDNYDCKITAVRHSKWHETSNKKINYIHLDLYKVNKYKLKRLVEDHDYIFHLAGDASVMADPEKEIDYLEKWISPLHNILYYMHNTNKVLVFASSVSVYGVNPKLPINEHTIEDPFTSYDVAKTCCDNLIRYYRNYYDVKCLSLRFSNVYGPETSIGKDSRRVINKILNFMHNNKEISIVSDGEYKRNYIHVYDAVSMLIHGARNVSRTSPVLIACSRENYSFKEIIICLAKNYENVFNKKIEIKLGLEKKFITDTRSFDGQPSKIFQVGFKYKYSLDEGFKELVKLI